MHTFHFACSRLRAGALSIGLLAMAATGCGGDNGLPASMVGQSIMTPSVSTVTVVNDGGGFTPAPPAGSKCLVGGRKFTLTVSTGDLTWRKCTGDGVVPYTEVSGGRALTSTELKDLTSLLEKLTVVKADGACIADAPMLSVTVQTTLATQQYVDDGFQCSVKDKPYLQRTAINDVLRMLEGYAK